MLTILLARVGLCSVLALAATPALAQVVKITRSTIAERPFTIIYPDSFTAAAGSNGAVLTITHRTAPLQCNLMVTTLEDVDWTADAALAGFNNSVIEAGWQGEFPGFSVASRSLVPFQSGPALVYEGESIGSPIGLPVRIVHAETMDQNRGYMLECLMPTRISDQARPLVDFLIRNFSARSDAACCAAPFPREGLR